MLSAYREFMPAAPRELNGFFAFATVPPGPPFPEEIHLRKVCGVVWCYVGLRGGRRGGDGPAAGPLREPLMHGVQPMPHAALQGAFDELYPKGDQWYWRADFVNEIPDEAVEIHAEFGAEMPTMKSTMHLYPIDGAAHDLGAVRHGMELPRRKWGRCIAGVVPDPAQGRRHPGVEQRLPPGAAPVFGRRRLREHDDGRGRSGSRELPRQLRPAGPHQGAL